jgi:hypothetical protein
VFQDVVSVLPDEFAARGNRAIALVAFVAQAVVGLFALRGEVSGIDGALTLAPIGNGTARLAAIVLSRY